MINVIICIFSSKKRMIITFKLQKLPIQLMHINLESLGTLLGEGAHGWVYTLKEYPQSVVKIAKKQARSLMNEAQILEQFRQSQSFPSIIQAGSFVGNSTNFSQQCFKYDYIVMQKLGISLEQLMTIRNNNISLGTIKKIGSQLLIQLQLLIVHKIIHNDIKPANILFGLGNKRSHAYFIDYGFAQRGQQIQDLTFRGNFMFSSSNRLRGHQSCHLDDLQSLIYLMLWMIWGGCLPWQGYSHNLDQISPKLKAQAIINSRCQFLSNENYIMDECTPEISKRSQLITNLLNILRQLWQDRRITVDQLITSLKQIL